ncbi:malectin domain-containing carbohydrate-binding protein [Cytophagaceae bacterium DM2B3-1]|uniref:Malectin domain-containing carbohydrate-binding protein n=1 Tax=Xanthocytophaga flava TaxID=3048013 RepID=A0ABT7CWE0_9BACT|nr:malectin domain-containing carbohydrate-binding protein [Xanthocytophaga flavus]MDJ1498093.1 malectin domain-containing carbohydrate-binding protein [Xanthocytophaga flavus]
MDLSTNTPITGKSRSGAYFQSKLHLSLLKCNWIGHGCLWLFVCLFALVSTRGQITPSPQLTAKLKAISPVQYDGFGNSIATDGNTMVTSNSRGAVYVFNLVNGSWSQTAKLAYSESIQDLFGFSIAVSGDRIVVGAPRRGNNRGAAYVYTRTNGTWSQTAKLIADDGKTNDMFGSSVAIEGTSIVVGAVHLFHQTVPGAAYVYSLNNGSWTQQAKLTAGEAGDNFGISVALQATTILVGASGTDATRQTDRGVVYVYTLTNGTWTQAARLLSADGKGGDEFGSKLVLNGNTFAASAQQADINSISNQGAVYVFNLVNGSWSQTAKLIADDGKLVDYADGFFGSSLALDGLTVSVIYNRKGVYIYTFNGSHWKQTDKLIKLSNKYRSVALKNNTLLAGSPEDTGDFTNEGAVYVYKMQQFTLPTPDTLSVALNQQLTDNQTAVLDLSWTDITGESGYILESISNSGESFRDFEIGPPLTRDTLPANTSNYLFHIRRGLADSARSFRLYAFHSDSNADTVHIDSLSSYTNVVRTIVPVQSQDLPPVSIPFRMDCGAGRTVITGGYTFAPDQYFTGSSTPRYFPNSGDIAGTTNDIVYQTIRSGDSFSYHIPITNGSYQVTLNFAEVYFTEHNRRSFSVNIESGVPEMIQFDAVTAAGGANRAVSRYFPVTVNDGILSIVFTSWISKAMISAIQITPIPANPSARVDDQEQATDPLAGSLIAYPNPFANQLTVSLAAPQTGKVTLSLIDRLGRIVYRQVLTVNDQQMEVGLGDAFVPSGLYLLQVTDNAGRQQAVKVVRQ